jgi:mono/diheme cytochrome c family protein
MRIQIVIIAAASVIFIAGCGQGISTARMERGKKVYQAYCQSCHMEDGAGVPDMNAPLKASPYVAGDKEKLISIVLKGSAAFEGGPERPYRNIMASMASLSDKEIADVLTYVRNSFTNKGSAVEAEEVLVQRK